METAKRSTRRVAASQRSRSSKHTNGHRVFVPLECNVISFPPFQSTSPFQLLSCWTVRLVIPAAKLALVSHSRSLLSFTVAPTHRYSCITTSLDCASLTHP